MSYLGGKQACQVDLRHHLVVIAFASLRMIAVVRFHLKVCFKFDFKNINFIFKDFTTKRYNVRVILSITLDLFVKLL